MALGTVLGAAAGGLASGAAGSIFGKLFGGGGNVSNKVANINAGGLRSRGGRITSSPLREGLVGQVAATFPEQARLLGGLRESVRPGFSALRESRLSGLDSDRRRVVGNLRDNLARRRVLGSSFASDAVTRSELDFSREADRVRAESFLQELDMTQQLVEQEFTARRGEFQTRLDELNLQAEIGTQLASGATAQLGANARLKAELASQAAAGAGRFFEPTANAIGSAVSGMFGGGSTAGAGGMGISPSGTSTFY